MKLRYILTDGREINPQKLEHIIQYIPAVYKIILDLSHNVLDADVLTFLLEVAQISSTFKSIEIKSSNFSSVDINEECSQLIANAIASNQNLTEIILQQMKFCEGGVKIFAEALANNNRISKLSLISCRLNDEDVKLIINAIKQNSALTDLLLAGNSITSEVILEISNMLGNNSTLKSLNISGVSIDSIEAEKLVTSLIQNQSLKELYLSDCDLCPEGMEKIAYLLNNNKSLTTIDISDNQNCGKESFVSFLNAVAQNNNIAKLYISDFSEILHDDVLDLLIDILKTKQTLKVLSVARCNLDDDELIKILDAVNLNQTLNKLFASENRINNENTFSYIREKFNNNLSLMRLDLSDCYGYYTHPFYIKQFNIEIHNSKYSKIAEMVVNAEKFKGTIKVKKLAELVFDVYKDVILDELMFFLEEKTPDNAKIYLEKLRNPTLSLTSQSGDEGLWGMLPQDMSNKVISHILPPYKDTFREKEEVNNKVYATQSL